MQLKNSLGFSMIELVIGLGLGAGAVLAITAVLMTAFTQSAVVGDAAEAEIEEMAAVNFMQAVFNQAVDVRAVGNNDLNSFSGSGGKLRNYDSDTDWAANPMNATVKTIAVFWRDSGKSVPNPTATGATTDFKKTFIYFQKPAQAPVGTQGTWGVLYANLGNDPSNLGPNRNAQVFEGFTRLQIKDVRTFSRFKAVPGINEPVTSFNLELTFRRFVGSRDDLKRHYCPDTVANTCGDNAPHRDIVRVQKITLRNNVIDASPSGPFGARLFDLIHFMQPRTPEAMR